MIADYISVFIIECKHVINCSRVTRVGLLITGTIPQRNIKFTKFLTFLLFSKSRRFILKSRVIRTSFLYISCLHKRSCKCFSNNVVLPCCGLSLKFKIKFFECLFRISIHKHSIASELMFKSDLSL